MDYVEILKLILAYQRAVVMSVLKPEEITPFAQANEDNLAFKVGALMMVETLSEIFIDENKEALEFIDQLRLSVKNSKVEETQTIIETLKNLSSNQKKWVQQKKKV